MNLSPLFKRGSFGAASITSRTSSVFTDDLRPEELGDRELVAAVQGLTTSNHLLGLENEVLERYLVRMDPSVVTDLQRLLEQAASTAVAHSRIHAVTSLMLAPQASGVSLREVDYSLSSQHTSSRQSPSIIKFGAGSYLGRGPRINVPQKAEMVAREMEEARRELLRLQECSKRARASLKAQLEETRLTLQEVRESGQVLERHVVQDVDPITGRVPAERFVRHMEESLKGADSLVEKLRLRTSTLKTQNTRAQQQLEQKEELGESLHPVDFEQLKIENKEFLERIEQKNYHLLELKKMTGRCALQLNNHKKSLAEQLGELAGLRASLAHHEAQAEALNREGQQVELELQRAEQQHEAIQELITNYMVPDVMEYVKKKAELHELKRAVKVWMRRKKIQQTALNSCAAVLRKMPHGSHFTISRRRPNPPSPTNEDTPSPDEQSNTDQASDTDN